MSMIGGILAVIVVAGIVIGLRAGKSKHAASTATTPATIMSPMASMSPTPRAEAPGSLAPLGVAPAANSALPNSALPGAALSVSPHAMAVPNGLTTIVPAPGGQMLTSRVRTATTVNYDPRVLPLLTVSNLPRELQQPTSIWELRGGFGPLPANDGATYAAISLGVKNPASAMAKVAAGVVAASPAASVKFVVHLDSNPATGIIRIALDGKRQRAAWIKKRADLPGSPYAWWPAASVSAPPALTPTVH